MKKRFHAVLACVLCVCILFSVTGALAAGFETAAEAVDHMGLGWNLGNALDSTGDWILQYTEGTVRDFETAWGNPVTPVSLMQKLKRLGFGAVRIPITWARHFDDKGNMDGAWMDRVQKLVDAAMDAGLYCIINMHHDTGSDGWLRASRANFNRNREKFEHIWRQIAERFASYPQELLFEGFNEMVDESNVWDNPATDGVTALNLYNQAFVDTVRSTGANNARRNLVCCTYAASCSERCMRAFRLPKDSARDHLIAEVHMYNPSGFAFRDEDVTWEPTVSNYSTTVEQTVDWTVEGIGNAFGNTPVIIGEFAAFNKNNTEDRVKWFTRVIRDAGRIGAVCFIWDNGNAAEMGYIDRVGAKDPFPEIIRACVEEAGRW